jgi:hypothetical protein
VSVPDPEETAWQRHGKIQATALNQLLAIHVAGAGLMGLQLGLNFVDSVKATTP